MGSAPSDGPGDGLLAAFKIVVAGGFGAGKTTLVGAVSEVRPLRTEETLSSASIGLDDLGGVANKTTTTVAMDFGRITISSRLVLYLFGTPGQERFWFMWDELSYGALGAVILADTRRLDDCFPSVDYFEKCHLPFIVAINCFDDSPRYDPEDVRVALDLDPRVPVMLCDARQLGSVKQVLITLVEHVLASRPLLLQGQADPPAPIAAEPSAMSSPAEAPHVGSHALPPPAGAPLTGPQALPPAAGAPHVGSHAMPPQAGSHALPPPAGAPLTGPQVLPPPAGAPQAGPYSMPPPAGAPLTGSHALPPAGISQGGPYAMPPPPGTPEPEADQDLLPPPPGMPDDDPVRAGLRRTPR